MARQTDHLSDWKVRLGAALDGRAPDLVRFGEDIFAHPEIGFKEERTGARVADELRHLGLEVQEGLAFTGVKARLRGARPGPRVCVLGELDGLPVPDHPGADPATGVAHACGHHCQLTHLVGVARALVETELAQHMAGEVVFFAVPAEEYVDLEWRSEQARAGRLELLGGKPELVRLGAFDDVDMALLVHATGRANDRRLSIRAGANGFLAKRVRFLGRASHAASAPERGVNALNAATLALQAIHMQRETFRDEDRVRVHPIITLGGTAVNVVPAEARVETFVRAATREAISEAAAKVDRALRAGAMAVGATVEIETLPGYLPLLVDPELGALFKANALALVGQDGFAEAGPSGASTDAGDLSHLMPLLQANHGGCAGTNHAADFAIADAELAYVTPAKALAWTVLDLLTDDAAEARRILAGYRPRMTKGQYLEYVRGMIKVERVAYA